MKMSVIFVMEATDTNRVNSIIYTVMEASLKLKSEIAM